MAMSIEKRVQRAAAKLLKFYGRTGKAWTYGAFARTKDRRITSIKDPSAVQFCLKGAMQKLRISPAVSLAFETTLQGEEEGGVVSFNDSHRTFTHVRKFLEKISKGKAAK